MNTFASIPEALEEIKKGNMLIVLDTEREQEADFFIPAQNSTPQTLMTMIRRGGGLICVALTQEQTQRLHIPLMVPPAKNAETTKLNLTVSVNAKQDITTGISAYDRTTTIRTLADPHAYPDDLTMPGHIFGVVANQGGILKRQGHTEAAVDLSRLAGYSPAGVLCEIIGKNGKMAQLTELTELAEALAIKMITITDLVAYLQRHPLPPLQNLLSVQQTATASLPTVYGTFKIQIYTSREDNQEHVVLSLGDITNQPVLTRIHSQCLTGEAFLSLRCDCRDQLHQSMKQIARHGNGVIVYLNQEGRSIGLTNKIKAYALQDTGLDTVQANNTLGFSDDPRDYRIAAEILSSLGITAIDLLTNNPDKENQLKHHGITVVKRIPLEVPPNGTDNAYLLTKKQKLHHILKMV